MFHLLNIIKNYPNINSESFSCNFASSIFPIIKYILFELPSNLTNTVLSVFLTIYFPPNDIY